MKNETYDKLKQIVQVGLPACGALYFGLDAQLDSINNGEQVVGCIAVLTTFLGVWLNIIANRYKNSDDAYDGKLVISENPEGKATYLLELTTDPEHMADMDRIIFRRVVTPTE